MPFDMSWKLETCWRLVDHLTVVRDACCTALVEAWETDAPNTEELTAAAARANDELDEAKATAVELFKHERPPWVEEAA